MSDQAPVTPGTKPRPTERNPETTARFRREGWWQIIFPVIVVSLIAVGLTVLVIVGVGADGTSVVADYSLILLLFPMILCGLPAAILLFWLISLLGKGLVGVPPYAFSAQQAMKRIYEAVDRATDRAAAAIITLRSVMTGLVAYARARGVPPAGAQDRPPEQ
ncbi:MAG: hypothetical protein Kow00124_07620 [Anaerolineae bacterium]